MEIVIELSEKVYNALTHTEFDANLVVDEMRKSIVKGTPLPEHHGDLIDKNTLEELCNQHPVIKGCLSHQLMISLRQDKDGDNIWENLLDYVPTIIEESDSE